RRPDGGHFLVARPRAREARTAAGRGGARRRVAPAAVPRPTVEGGRSPRRRTAALQTKRNLGAPRVPAGGAFGWLFGLGLEAPPLQEARCRSRHPNRSNQGKLKCSELFIRLNPELREEKRSCGQKLKNRLEGKCLLDCVIVFPLLFHEHDARNLKVDPHRIVPVKPCKPFPLGKCDHQDQVYANGRLKNLVDHLPCQPDELYFEEGDIIYITDMSDTNWWKGTCKGKTGLIPSNYVAAQAESIDNPLHEAAKRGNLSWLRECLDNRVGVNGLDKAGSTALYWACHGGHKDIVEMLFTQPNIELNQQNKLGDTALHAAAWKGYADIVQLLLEKGARTDLRNNEKKLALDMATNAACASLLKKKLGTDAVRTLSNAEDYLDDEDSD
uniref:Osteoclast-stimulating factor 1 n=1 Tax=Suricata suricatta TaxID=37032 RepID=A0A673UUK0_SURSU